jgi:hypothetical protein
MVPLPGGVSVRVEAYCFVGGHVTVKYSDEGVSRSVTSTRDYVYPCDLRLDPQSSRLYVKSEGVAGGLWHEVTLHEYDLGARRSMQSVHASGQLPAECPEAGRANSAG